MANKVIIKGFHNRQKEIANQIISSSAKFHTVNASRQSGKSHLAAKLAIVLAMQEVNEQIMVVSPSYEQVRSIFDKILANGNISLIISSMKESKPYEITFISGTVVKFKSADRPDTLRGGTYKYILADELAFHKEGSFDTIIRPTTAAKKDSKIISFSTPKGKHNKFYELVKASEEDSNYCYYEMSYRDNPYYDLKEVEDAKKSLPEAIFRQEYEAEFIDDGGEVFSKISSSFSEYEGFISGKKYYAGIDWGRLQDRTILTIINNDKKVAYIGKWQGIDWSDIIANIVKVLKVYKPIVYSETNGIGDPLLSQLKKSYFNVKPFITSTTSKREIIESLLYDLGEGILSIPDSDLEPELYTEMADYTFTINKVGTISYHHKTGKHDDMIDSLAIANYCLRKHNKGFVATAGLRSTFYSK